MKKRLKVLITMMLAFILAIGITVSASAKTAATKTYKTATQSILRLASTDPDMPIQK